MMNTVAKYWKVLVALLLIGAAAFFYFHKYQVEKAAYESKTNQLETTIMVLERNIQENQQYADIQDELDEAKAELEASRLDLYQSFPVEMKEEDQIMYVLYLETLFKEEIYFSFNQAQVKTLLQDGAALQYLELVVNYKTTYKGFQDMVEYLATDSRVASVREATIDYDAENDAAVGQVALWLYLMDTDMMEYQKPDVAVPATGKDNIFESKATGAAAATKSTTATKTTTTSATASTAQTTQSDVVWATETGGSYHNKPNCGNMTYADKISVNEAINRGLTACKKCYG